MAEKTGRSGDFLDWLPTTAPGETGLNPAQIVARRSRTVPLRPDLERFAPTLSVRRRLAAVESGDVAAVLGPAARSEVKALRTGAGSPSGADPGSLPLVVMAMWCRVLAGKQSDRDTEGDENETVARAFQLYTRVPSLLPPELADAVLIAGPGVIAAVAERSGQPALMIDVARLLRNRYERFGNEGDLDAAEETLDVVRRFPGVPRADTDMAGLELAQTLTLRFDHTGHAGALERAADLLAELRRDAGPSLRADVDGLGCLVYRLRYGLRGAVDDLDAAVEAGLASLQERDDPSVRNNLTLAWWERFVARGGRENLRLAVETQTELLDATPRDHPARAGRASNLAAVLHQAHRHTGDLGRLDDAEHHAREAISLTPPDHLDRGGYLNNLAAILQDRFTALGTEGDLTEAVEILEQAVRATPADSRHLSGFLSTLGALYARRYETLGDPTALDRAVRVLTRAVGATGPGTVEYGIRTANLAEALRSDAERSGSAELLERAVATARRAVAETADGHRGGAVHLFTLGRALADRYRTSGDDEDLREARVHLSAVLQMTAAPPLLRAQAGQFLAELLAGRDWPASAAAAAAAVQCFDELVDHRVDRPGRQRHLAVLQGLARDGAAAALAADDPEGALGLLEQGRGVLIAQALESRQDLSAVRALDPALADEIVQLGYALSADLPDPRAREALARRWDKAVARARALTGDDSFNAPPGVAELRGAASAGPVVHVNVSRYRVDALILTAEGLEVLPLPGLDAAGVDAAAVRVAEATGVSSWETNDTLLGVLEYLWDGLCRPVLCRLERLSGASGGQVWWVPSGSLALLPLTAAGLHRTAPAEDRALRERWVTSVAPTLRALRRQRETGAVLLDASSPLVVAFAGEGKQALRKVAAEAEHVAAALGAAEPPLLERRATRAAVTAALPSRTCAHMACHAVSEPDPLESRLLLADGPLTVRDLLAVHLAHASLAFLSACTTADPGRELTDEALHVSTAFQLAGYPHVIGTLWPVSDDIAPAVARDVYAGLATRPPAEALHHVLCAQSTEHAASPFVWAPYVHLGP